MLNWDKYNYNTINEKANLNNQQTETQPKTYNQQSTKTKTTII